jgi:hypothetical protein
MLSEGAHPLAAAEVGGAAWPRGRLQASGTLARCLRVGGRLRLHPGGAGAWAYH